MPPSSTMRAMFRENCSTSTAPTFGGSAGQLFRDGGLVLHAVPARGALFRRFGLLFRHINGINLFEAILTDTALVVHCNLSAKDVERATYPGLSCCLPRRRSRLPAAARPSTWSPKRLAGCRAMRHSAQPRPCRTPTSTRCARRGRRDRSRMPSRRSSSPTCWRCARPKSSAPTRLRRPRHLRLKKRQPPSCRRASKAAGAQEQGSCGPEGRHRAGCREKARRTNEACQLIRTFHRPFRPIP